MRCAGRCGERTERCRWQKQRSERVAAVKISGVRRKAAQKFWAPQQDHRPLRKRISGCVGEGLSCPPSCQPTDGHCCARQSGHFLETGSLHPPLAALRRFPLPRATARVAPTEGYKKCGGAGRCGHRPLRVHNKRCGERGIPQSRLRPLGKGAEGTGNGLPRAQSALAMTGGFTWVRWADECR